MPSALGAMDPFAIALWTLVVCGFVFLVYLTVALGRFLHGVEDMRSRFETLSAELSETARALRARSPEPAVPAATPPAAPQPPAAPAPAPSAPQEGEATP